MKHLFLPPHLTPSLSVMSDATNVIVECDWLMEDHRFDNISVKVSLIGQRHTTPCTDKLYHIVRLQMQEPRIQDIFRVTQALLGQTSDLSAQASC